MSGRDVIKGHVIRVGDPADVVGVVHLKQIQSTSESEIWGKD